MTSAAPHGAVRDDLPPRERLLRRARLGSHEPLVFATAVLLPLVPLVALPAVVTVDGPAHVAGGWLLSHLNEPSVRAAYEVRAFPAPNLLTELLLAVLTRALPLVAAEKVLVAGWFLLLPLALRYALGGVAPTARWLAILAVPFTTNYLYYYGFYNYCYGLGLFLVVLGFAIRRRSRWTARSTAALAGLLLATYLSHLLPFLVALLALGAIALADLVAQPGAAVRSCMALAIAALPSLALTALFAARTSTVLAPAWGHPIGLAVGLLSLTRLLLVYDAREALATALLAIVLVALGVVALRRDTPRLAGTLPTGLASATAGCLVLYAVAPARLSADFGFLNDRLALFPVLLGTLWLGTRTYRPAIRVAATAAVLVATLALAALRLPTELQYQRDVAEFTSAGAAVPAGSRLVALRLWLDTPVNGPVANVRRDPLRHLASRVAAERGGVDVGHYETAYDYFPLRFRSTADVWRAIDPDRLGLEQVPPRVDLSVPAARSIDVILLVGHDRATPAALAAPRTRRLLAQIAAGYRRVAVTRPSGLVEVYLRR